MYSVKSLVLAAATKGKLKRWKHYSVGKRFPPTTAAKARESDGKKLWHSE
jgi:hypothetical protein